MPSTNKDYIVGAGGSPEGVAIDGLKFDTPSGPLCFFLGSEKEEPASGISCKEANSQITLAFPYTLRTGTPSPAR